MPDELEGLRREIAAISALLRESRRAADRMTLAAVALLCAVAILIVILVQGGP